MLTVDCLSQGKDVTDGESMEAVSEPGASMDVGDPELPEQEVKDNFAAAKTEVETEEMEREETEAAVGSSPVSPPNPSPPQSSSSTEETVSTVLVKGGEPDSTSASEKGGSEVKVEEDFDSNEESVSTCKILEERPAGPDVSGETNMDKSSEHNTDINSDIKMDPDIDTQQENVSQACKFRVSTADDLDEMMDIGTVDQVEQEAQMKEEEQNRLTDVGSSCSPAISNTGKVKPFLC